MLVCNCINKNQQDMRDALFLTFGVLGFKVVNKRTMNLFKGSQDFDFQILSSQIELYLGYILNKKLDYIWIRLDYI